VNSPTHIAFADESYYTNSRYRSIAVITLEASHEKSLTPLFKELLEGSGLTEFKWEKLRQARERFAALKMLEKTIELSIKGQMRVDVLIWDTQDSRHRIQGRDDIANFQRMYYHLFKNVLQRRWPAGSTWQLCPDENSALDWTTVQDYLDVAGLNIRVEGNLFDEGSFSLRLERDFNILEICEACSSETPLCQLADLFAGLGAYSHSAYDNYEHWLRAQSGQMPLGLDFGSDCAEPKLSNKDRERCTVIKYLDDVCKRCKLYVGLKSSRGFKTHDPGFPINFWLYEPQHPDDKAPVRG
jgi:hypothetical protein